MFVFYTFPITISNYNNIILPVRLSGILTTIISIYLFCHYIYTKSFKLFPTDEEINATSKLLKDWKLIAAIISFPLCFILVTGFIVGQVMLLTSMQMVTNEVVPLMPIIFDLLLVSCIIAAILAVTTLPLDYILFKSSIVFTNTSK